MAAPILGTPCPQFLDGNGNPLASGLVYVYQPDTTTARNSYPTADDANAATNANAHPVVLDSNGYARIHGAHTLRDTARAQHGTRVIAPVIAVRKSCALRHVKRPFDQQRRGA